LPAENNSPTRASFRTVVRRRSDGKPGGKSDQVRACEIREKIADTGIETIWRSPIPAQAGLKTRGSRARSRGPQDGDGGLNILGSGAREFGGARVDAATGNRVRAGIRDGKVPCSAGRRSVKRWSMTSPRERFSQGSAERRPTEWLTPHGPGFAFCNLRQRRNLTPSPAIADEADKLPFHALRFRRVGRWARVRWRQNCFGTDHTSFCTDHGTDPTLKIPNVYAVWYGWRDSCGQFRPEGSWRPEGKRLAGVSLHGPPGSAARPRRDARSAILEHSRKTT